MEENKNPLPFTAQQSAPQAPVRITFPTGKRELSLAAILGLLGLLLVDFIVVGGLQMAFGITAALIIGGNTLYLIRNGRKLTFYSGALLTLSMLIALSFGRSEVWFVKFVMFFFLCFSSNLGLCLLGRKNRQDPKGFTSLVDIFRTVFMLGLGQMLPAFRGLIAARKTGKTSRTIGAVLVGLLVAVPLVLVLIVLLAHADAAFAGLMDKLPKIQLWEPIVTLMFGVPFAVYLYIRGVALQHAPEKPSYGDIQLGINALTVNTVLGAVCLVYGVYLFSQLAYFVGGLQGILPKEFTMSEYARRGFFEMAAICFINLFVVSLAVGLTRKDGKSPLSTRLLCLFIGVITLFLTVTASAKMVMYIESYGLTRLRVLTEVVILFMALATIFVSIWLFIRQMPYMKAIVLTALLLGAAVAWADVDTVVACYNVRAYQSGSLEKVDVQYLADLSDSAIPYIAELTDDANPDVAKKAVAALQMREYWETKWESNDFRAWNIADAIADRITKAYSETVTDD